MEFFFLVIAVQEISYSHWVVLNLCIAIIVCAAGKSFSLFVCGAKRKVLVNVGVIGIITYKKKENKHFG